MVNSFPTSGCVMNLSFVHTGYAKPNRSRSTPANRRSFSSSIHAWTSFYEFYETVVPLTLIGYVQVRRSVQFFLDNLLNQRPDQEHTLSAIGEV